MQIFPKTMAKLEPFEIEFSIYSKSILFKFKGFLYILFV